METIQIELKNSKQSTLIKELLKELRIRFVSIPQEESDLYGKGFKKSIDKGLEEYRRGECVEIKLDDLWK